jgi:hypothetical protein
VVRALQAISPALNWALTHRKRIAIRQGSTRRAKSPD